MTGVQLEVGRNATDFEHRSYGEELALKQRYFFKLSNSRLVGGYKRHDGSSNFAVNSPVPMRAQPTPSLTVGGSFTNFQSNSIAELNLVQTFTNGPSLVVDLFSQVSSTWSSTHTFVPSWESFTAEFNSEL